MTPPSKGGLLVATASWVWEAEDERRQAAPGDPRAAARALVARYEEVGDALMWALAAEERVPAMHEVLERGREGHREWLKRHFASALVGGRGADYERRLALLYAATDVRTRKLWRRDLGLSRRRTELAMAELLELLVGAERGKEKA